MPGKDASQGNTTASLSRNVLSVTGLVPATSAMILYDCLLTFVSELELFWLKPSKGFAGTLLFGLNRLAAIVWIISENSGPGPPAFSHPSCKASVLLEAASTVLVNAIWGAISAVRVHALTRRSWFLSASTFLLAVAPISVTYGIVSNKVDTYKMGQTQVCVLSVHFYGAVNTMFMLSRVCNLVSDLVVLLVTLHHTRPRHLIMLPKRSLTGVLCKDGTLYFIALTILNALALIMYFTSPPDSVSDFLVPATTIAASRLMLSMRAAVYEPGSVSEPGTLVFARRFDHSGQSETQHARFPEFAGQFELEDLRAPAATTSEDADDDELMQRHNEIVEAPLR